MESSIERILKSDKLFGIIPPLKHQIFIQRKLVYNPVIKILSLINFGLGLFLMIKELQSLNNQYQAPNSTYICYVIQQDPFYNAIMIFLSLSFIGVGLQGIFQKFVIPRTYLNFYKYRYLGTTIMGIILIGTFSKRMSQVSNNINTPSSIPTQYCYTNSGHYQQSILDQEIFNKNIINYSDGLANIIIICVGWVIDSVFLIIVHGSVHTRLEQITNEQLLKPPTKRKPKWTDKVYGFFECYPITLNKLAINELPLILGMLELFLVIYLFVREIQYLQMSNNQQQFQWPRETLIWFYIVIFFVQGLISLLAYFKRNSDKIFFFHLEVYKHRLAVTLFTGFTILCSFALQVTYYYRNSINPLSFSDQAEYQLYLTNYMSMIDVQNCWYKMICIFIAMFLDVLLFVGIYNWYVIVHFFTKERQLDWAQTKTLSKSIDLKRQKNIKEMFKQQDIIIEESPSNIQINQIKSSIEEKIEDDIIN